MLAQLKHLVENIQQVARELDAMEKAHREPLAAAAEYIKFQAMVRAVRNGLAFAPIAKRAGDDAPVLTLREGVLAAVRPRETQEAARVEEQELWLLQDGTFLHTQRTGTQSVWKREKAPLQKEPFLHWGAETVGEGLLRVLEGQAASRRERVTRLDGLLCDLQDREKRTSLQDWLPEVRGELSYAPICSQVKIVETRPLHKEAGWLGKGVLVLDGPAPERETASRELWLLEEGAFCETLFYGGQDGYRRDIAAPEADPLANWADESVAKGLCALLERERSQQQRLLVSEEQLAAEVRAAFFPVASAGVSLRRTACLLMQKRAERLAAQTEECRAELFDLPRESVWPVGPTIADCIAACLPLFSFDTVLQTASGPCRACLLDDEEQHGTRCWRELYVTRDGRFLQVRYREAEEVDGTFAAGVHEVEKEFHGAPLDGWKAHSVLERMLTYLEYVLEDLQDLAGELANGFRVLTEELQ